MYNKDSLNFLRVINDINKEIQFTKMLNLNNLVLKLFIRYEKLVPIQKLKEYVAEDADNYLNYFSEVYHEISTDYNYRSIYALLNTYIQNLTNYYFYIFHEDASKFDRYIEISSGRMPDKNIIKDEHIIMDYEELQRSMNALNEAVRRYYEIYHNKRLIADFSNNEKMEFKIKEAELSHVLGLNMKKIVLDDKYRELFHITDAEKEVVLDTTFTLDPERKVIVDLLHRIIDLNPDDIYQLEHDRIKKFNQFSFKYKEEEKPDVLLRQFSKVNMRSKAFIDFRPLEELSLALDFPEGYDMFKVSKKTNSKHGLLISKNSLSRIFRYSSLVTNIDRTNNRRYFQSLLIKQPDEFEQWQKDAIPSITLKVELAPDDHSGGGSVISVFSTEQQLRFIYEVINDFKYIKIEPLVDYFKNITKKMDTKIKVVDNSPYTKTNNINNYDNILNVKNDYLTDLDKKYAQNNNKDIYLYKDVERLLKQEKERRLEEEEKKIKRKI